MTVLELLRALENGRGNYNDPVLILALKKRPGQSPLRRRVPISTVAYNRGGAEGKPAMEIIIME